MLTVLACVAVVLSGCATGASTPGAAPSASVSPVETSAPAVPDATPTPTPTPVAPPAGCDDLATAGDAGGIVVDLGSRWLVREAAAATLGGLACYWPGSNLELSVFPSAAVPEEVRTRMAESPCESWGYDGQACYASAEEGGYWYLAAVLVEGAWESDTAPSAAAAASIVAAIPPLELSIPGAPERTDAWWQDATCERLTHDVDWPFEIHVTDPPGVNLDGSSNPTMDVLNAHAAQADCSWGGVVGDPRQVVNAEVIPGGAAGWDLVAAGDSVDIPGATQAVEFTDIRGLSWLIVTDGTNLIQIMSQADADAGVVHEVASAMLAGAR